MSEEQKPVAWQVHPFDYGIGHEGVYARTDRPEQVAAWERKGWKVQPLYARPPMALTPAQQHADELLEALKSIAEYTGEGPPTTPWQEIVRGISEVSRAAIARATNQGEQK